MPSDADLPSSGEHPVLLEQDEAILTVTLNRPHRKNALDDQAWSDLYGAVRTARANDDVRAVVLTGSGGDFCAGADLARERGGEHPSKRMRSINEIAIELFELPKPVVAKVSGVAVGAGWNLALACDLVVASREARFSQIFARRGLSLDVGGSWLLPRIIGLQQAKRLALLGDFVDAPEAHDLGLVTWVRSAEEIDAFVLDVARRLASGPPVALAQSKELLNEGVNQTFREALSNEARAQAVNFATEDTAAALEAFKSKTEPVFTGGWNVR